MAAMGYPNASIPTPQPVHYRPMFASFGGAVAKTSLTFVSQAGLAAGIGAHGGGLRVHLHARRQVVVHHVLLLHAADALHGRQGLGQAKALANARRHPGL